MSWYKPLIGFEVRQYDGRVIAENVYRRGVWIDGHWVVRYMNRTYQLHTNGEGPYVLMVDNPL